MPVFSYKVRNNSKTEKGVIESVDISTAAKSLKSQGFIVLELTEGHGKNKALFIRKKVPLKEKIIFGRQLSVMIHAGLPVVKALESLSKQTENLYFKEIINSCATVVKGGGTLSSALSRYPTVFSQMYIAVIKAGEQTGQLSDVLTNLVDQQEKEADLIGKIKGAMVYPAVILVTMIGVGVLVVFFVMPNLKSIFSDSGQQLPLLTRILLGTSDFVLKYYYVVIILLFAFFVFAKWYFKSKSGQALYDHLKIRLPVFGSLTKKVYMARFSRTLAMLIYASLPINQALNIVQKTIQNVHYDAAFTRIGKLVENGRTLSSAIEREPLFPNMVSQLTNLGEETGNLEATLLEVAKFYDSEVNDTSKNLATLLEPLMLVLMGIGVGLMVAAVLGPIYGLVQNFSG